MRVYSSPPPLSSSSSPSSSSASATPRATIPKIVVSTVEVVRNLSPPFIYSIYLSIYPGNTINVKVCAACVMIDVALSHSRSMSNPLYIKSSQSPVVRRLITIIIIAYGFYAVSKLSYLSTTYMHSLLSIATCISLPCGHVNPFHLLLWCMLGN